MIRYEIMKHIWRYGHSIEVRKFKPIPDSRLLHWFYVCDCGKQWAR